MSIEPGLEATVEHVVVATDTASALGSGDVDVLGTPALVALCERAAVAAMAGSLDTGQTTVGTAVSVDHVAPTAIGRRVVAHARLEGLDGRTLHFAIDAADDSGSIASGTHARVIVERARFIAGVDERR